MLAHTVNEHPAKDLGVPHPALAPAAPWERPRPAWRWAAFALAVGLDVAVLLAPDPDVPGVGVPGLDKAVHAGLFALLTATGLWAGLSARWFVPAVLGWAALSEVLQATLLPARSGDAGDVLADALGVGLGVVAVAVATRRSRRRRSPQS